MTTWIYKNGIIVSDSLVTENGYKVGEFKKIHKTQDGWLAAGAGSISDINKFFKWAEVRDIDDIVKLDNLDGFLVSPEGETFCVETDFVPYKIKGNFFTGGSGANLAQGALAAGATIMDAMDVAFKYDVHTGGEIFVEKLDDKIIRKLESEKNLYSSK